ncbi:MAG: transketolase C-terminal domain-containing protein [Eubacteriales bacterium]|nr:transketolase C-terminal domain-containing protein [Eubacteriales bacterium]
MSKQNQREEYGKALVALGKENPDIVVLEADLGNSTRSILFQNAFPDRFFEMGIAEQNMTSFAGGLALAGKIPFTNTFAVFAAGRPYDQIRQSIATAKLNVKIVGSSAGFSDFGDGATHQAIDDMAIMSAIPNMTVLAPCDGREAVLAVREAVSIDGPVYIRLCRNDLEDIFPQDIPYRADMPVVLREGTDLAVFTTGIMAHKALEAARILEQENISVQVIHLPGIKPVNEEAILALAKGKRGVLTCEEHSIRGGLSMLITYLLRNEDIPVECAAVMDVFGQSGSSQEELLAFYGLDAKALCVRARGLMNR